MNTFLHFLILGVVVAGTALNIPARADSGTNPNFEEVRSVLLEHLAGATEAQLNQAAVNGLLGQLKGRVALVQEADTTSTNAPILVAADRQFDGGIGYIRIKNTANGLAGAVSSAISDLTASNKLIGLVLDLRYADGTDYAAAAETVDIFLSDEVPLLNAGKGLISSKAKENAVKLPVVALVNQDTSSAAEALAAMLRKSGVGLLIGSSTAGKAGVTTDYQLTTGQTLRVLTAPIQLGDAKAISTDGVKPDVEVTVKADDEAKYYDDPFAQVANGSRTVVSEEDNASRVRVTEADLVREKRGDGDLETLAGQRVKAEDRSPRVTDPALARGIDLLKGLAVVRQWKF